MVTALAVSGNIFADLSNSNDCLTSSQLFFSQAIQNFSTEATSCSSLFGIVCGQLIAPFVRLQSIGCFSSLLGNGQQARFFTHYFSLGLSLGAEGAGMHLGTQLIRTGRIEENSFGGSLHSTLTILACKMTSKVVPPNIVMLHLAQDGAMVSLNEGLAKIGIGETETGTIVEKLAHAEITAIQLQCSAILMSVAAPQVSMIHAKCEINYKVGAPLAAPFQILPLKSLSSADFLITSSLMLGGCEGEWPLWAGTIYLLARTSGIPQKIYKAGTNFVDLQVQKRKITTKPNKENFFELATGEFFRSLDGGDKKDKQKDPHLMKVLDRNRRFQLIQFIDSLFPETDQTQIKAAYLGDIFQTALLTSRTPDQFAKHLDAILLYHKEIKEGLEIARSQRETEKGILTKADKTPSGLFTDLLIRALKKDDPVAMSSLSSDHRHSSSSASTSSSVNPFADTPPEGMEIRPTSTVSLGSMHTHLERTIPSSLTVPVYRSFLPEDGSPISYIVTVHDGDLTDYAAPLFMPVASIFEGQKVRSIQRGQSLPAHLILTTTSSMVEDLIRLEETPPFSRQEEHRHQTTPVYEIFTLRKPVPFRFRMEARYLLKDSKIARIFEESEKETPIIIGRKLIAPFEQEVGSIETAFLDQKSLNLFGFHQLPSVDQLALRVPVTLDLVRQLHQGVYFQEKGNYRFFIRALAYELLCHLLPFNPNLPHRGSFLSTGIRIEPEDILDFYVSSTRQGPVVFVYNIENQLVFQMHLQIQGGGSTDSTGPFLTRSSSSSFSSAPHTTLEGVRGYSGETLVEGDEESMTTRIISTNPKKKE